MKTYQALLQERADLVAEAKKIFAAATTEGRDLTEAEKTRDDEINARLTALAGDIAREERRREWERTVAPAVPDGNVQAGQRAQMSVRERAEDDPRRGFRNLADFALSVRQASLPGGSVDERLRIGAAPTSYHETGGTAGEGYMVPPAMRQEIWNVVNEIDSLLSEVESEPTSSNSVEFNKDETTPWGATGVQAAWRAEGVQMTASKLATTAETMKLHELYAFVLATEELLQDAPRLNARLTNKAGQAIRYKLNEAFVNGTGAGQPLGWFTSSAKVSVAKETSQVAATLVAANVAKMYARVINPGMANWYVNQDVLPQLLTMTLGNNSVYVLPSAGFQNAPGGFLLGRPVKFLENCQTIGTQGDIQLVNPKGYYAVTKGSNPDFADSIHLYFDYNIRAFRWIFRANGQPFLSAAISPAKGSTTRSHFVVLDTRA